MNLPNHARALTRDPTSHPPAGAQGGSQPSVQLGEEPVHPHLSKKRVCLKTHTGEKHKPGPPRPREGRAGRGQCLAQPGTPGSRSCPAQPAPDVGGKEPRTGEPSEQTDLSVLGLPRASKSQSGIKGPFQGRGEAPHNCPSEYGKGFSHLPTSMDLKAT